MTSREVTAYFRDVPEPQRTTLLSVHATPARLLRPTFRNFYTPDRGDVFCGFRTCAVG